MCACFFFFLGGGGKGDADLEIIGADRAKDDVLCAQTAADFCSRCYSCLQQISSTIALNTAMMHSALAITIMSFLLGPQVVRLLLADPRPFQRTMIRA